MPIFTQAIAIAVALAYIGCARALDALARTLLVLRSFLPEDTYGYKLSGRTLDELPELPAPLLVRCAFVSEQAGMLCIIGVLSAILLLPLAVVWMAGTPATGTPATQAQAPRAWTGPDALPDQWPANAPDVPDTPADDTGGCADAPSPCFSPGAPDADAGIVRPSQDAMTARR